MKKKKKKSFKSGRGRKIEQSPEFFYFRPTGIKLKFRFECSSDRKKSLVRRNFPPMKETPQGIPNFLDSNVLKTKKMIGKNQLLRRGFGS